MRALLPAALFLTLALAGCAGSTSSTGAPVTTAATSTTAAGPQTHAVAISGFKFAPADLTVHVGDTVTWTNDDSTDHTVTDMEANGFDSGHVANGGTFTHTFTQAGTYPYHCMIHSTMTATVTVQ